MVGPARREKLPIDDILRPSLGEEDDAAGFDQPWNPNTLVFITFFSGLLGGGVLLALNFKRLGMHSRYVPALAAVVAVALASYAVAAWCVAGGVVEVKDRTPRLALRAVSIAAALSVAAFQTRRFRLFQRMDLPWGSLLWPAVAALVLGNLLSSSLLGALIAIFRA